MQLDGGSGPMPVAWIHVGQYGSRRPEGVLRSIGISRGAAGRRFTRIRI
jgi:hypothetical protein